MSQVEINFAFKIWCDKHQQVFKDANANMAHAMGLLMQRTMNEVQRAAEAKYGPDHKLTPEEFKAELEIVHARETPMCCMAGEDFIEQLLGEVQQSTGDDDADEDIMLQEVKSIERGRSES